ncbi:MAG: type III pantothenate kinase [Pelagibacteraceae bacterium]|jgi:type III pantothenate kinase|nr:type III pantothenate kinase [Pelagibacteraceae bacterium]
MLKKNIFKEMNYLVGDIGNTSTKICLVNNNSRIVKEYIIETKNLLINNNINKFFNSVLKKKIKKNILFSSVVPKIYNKINKFLINKNFKTIELKSLPLKKILKINIDNYKDLGSDRIANSIGAFKLFKTNCLIVDFGTATTFDIIKKPGIYEGGVIAPGIKLSILNLSNSTASLPIFELKSNSKIFGKNTKDALNAGFLWGYQGLILNIIKKINSKFKTNFKIILTGGYASMFAKFINNNAIIERHITIKGIMFIYKNLIK